MSELMRSDICQSGPDSRSTTFLPALARTAANTEPDAPAPTITTSTFSLAMSPPPARRDVRHVGDAERGIAVHGAVDDIDGVAAQQQVDEWPGRALPAFDLVLAHVVDEVALLCLAELCKAATIERLAGAIDRAECHAVKIRIGRADVEDAGFEQGLLRRDRDLLIDEMGYPSLEGARDERLAQRVERCRLGGGQCPQRHAPRPC